MPTTFIGIQNENEFYSHHYLSEVFTNDIKATTTRWRETATKTEDGQRAPDQALRALARPYLKFRQQFRRERRHQAPRSSATRLVSPTLDRPGLRLLPCQPPPGRQDRR